MRTPHEICSRCGDVGRYTDKLTPEGRPIVECMRPECGAEGHKWIDLRVGIVVRAAGFHAQRTGEVTGITPQGIQVGGLWWGWHELQGVVS